MKAPREDRGGKSLIYFATKLGESLCIWTSSQDKELRIVFECVRFLTDGQRKIRGKRKPQPQCSLDEESQQAYLSQRHKTSSADGKGNLVWILHEDCIVVGLHFTPTDASDGKSSATAFGSQQSGTPWTSTPTATIRLQSTSNTLERHDLSTVELSGTSFAIITRPNMIKK